MLELKAQEDLRDEIKLIRLALERLSPKSKRRSNYAESDAYIWRPFSEGVCLEVVNKIDTRSLDLLLSVDDAKDQLYKNTLKFAKGLSGQNALIWGARGMGKSTLVKSVFLKVKEAIKEEEKIHGVLKIIEIYREEIETLPRLMDEIKDVPARFLVYCDDLSFDNNEITYKALKRALDGGLSGTPSNVLFYATSNRRHVISREMIENEAEGAINTRDVVDEKMALSDRFGLWIGVHNCSFDEFLNIVKNYYVALKLDRYIKEDDLIQKAKQWSNERGGKSGRLAWQFINEIASEKGVKVPTTI